MILDILTPEITILCTALGVLMAEVFVGKRFPLQGYYVSLIALAFVSIYTALNMNAPEQTIFYHSFIFDGLGNLLKLFVYITTALTLVYSLRYLTDRSMLRGEFYAMILFAVLGMQVLVSAANMLMVYMGLELMSLSIYALVAWRRNDALVTEAAMKYFVLGGLSSGMLLYGMSMIYGATGSIQLNQIAQAVMDSNSNDLLYQFGLVFLVVGVAFKLGAVPFHMWMPDVYHGAPTVLTLFIATASKLAVLGMLMRMWVEALEPVLADIQTMIISLSALSIILGNVMALTQKNLKRMLAFSAIAHMGFVLMGIAAQDYNAALYYMIVYAITSAAGFGIIMWLADQNSESDQFDDLKGLSKRSPLVALFLLVVIFSMAGIPPLVGFYAKFLILKSAVDSGLVELAITGVVMSVVGAFYYLRVIRMMYFEDSTDERSVPDASLGACCFMTLNVSSLLVLGIIPAPLLGLCYWVLS